jgi:hypothetical protein
MESQPHKLTDHQEVGEEIDLHWFAHGWPHANWHDQAMAGRHQLWKWGNRSSISATASILSGSQNGTKQRQCSLLHETRCCARDNNELWDIHLEERWGKWSKGVSTVQVIVR